MISAGRTVAEGKVAGGKYSLSCPADCRIRVEAAGHEPGLKSIFLDCDPLYRGVFRPLRRERMTDPALYSEIERLLSDVVLDFRLRRLP